MKGGKDRVREGIARSKEGQSEGYFMGRAGREKRKGASSHPTQSSTPIHPSSVSAQRLPLLHQHQLLVHLVHVRACVCVCVGWQGDRDKVYEYMHRTECVNV